MSSTKVRTLSYNVAVNFIKDTRKYKGRHKIAGYTWLKKLDNNNIELHWHDDAVAEIRPDNKVILKRNPIVWGHRAKTFFNIINAGRDPAGMQTFCVGWTIYQKKYRAGSSAKFIFELGTVIDPIDFKLVRGRFPSTTVNNPDKAKAWRIQILHFLKECRTFCKLGVVERSVQKRLELKSYDSKYLDVDKMYFHIENKNSIEFIQECIEVAWYGDIKKWQHDVYKLLSPSYNRFSKRLKQRADVYTVIPGAYYVDDREQETTTGSLGEGRREVPQNVQEGNGEARKPARATRSDDRVVDKELTETMSDVSGERILVGLQEPV